MLPAAGYLTLLQLSRASLLASAHHLSLPANVGQVHTEWAALAASLRPSAYPAAGLWGFGLCGLGYVRLAAHARQGRRGLSSGNQRRHLRAPARLRDVHGRIGLLLGAALLPLWADFGLSLVAPLFWA